jgi:hypothetical protein
MELTVCTIGPPQLATAMLPAACTKSAALTPWFLYELYLVRRKLRKPPRGSFTPRPISSSLKRREPSAPPLAGADCALVEEYPAVRIQSAKGHTKSDSKTSTTNLRHGKRTESHLQRPCCNLQSLSSSLWRWRSRRLGKIRLWQKLCVRRE